MTTNIADLSYDEQRAWVRDNAPPEQVDMWLSSIDREERSDKAEPAVMPPCPAWCTLEQGHRYDSHDGGFSDDDVLTLYRCHTDGDAGTFGGVYVQESFTDGQVTLGEPYVVVGDVEHRDPGEVRRHARELLALADRLERIGGQR